METGVGLVMRDGGAWRRGPCAELEEASEADCCESTRSVSSGASSPQIPPRPNAIVNTGIRAALFSEAERIGCHASMRFPMLRIAVETPQTQAHANPCTPSCYRHHSFAAHPIGSRASLNQSWNQSPCRRPGNEPL